MTSLFSFSFRRMESAGAIAALSVLIVLLSFKTADSVPLSDAQNHTVGFHGRDKRFVPGPGPIPPPPPAAISEITVARGVCPGGPSMGRPCDAKRPWPQCPPQSYCFAVNSVDIGPYYCCPVWSTYGAAWRPQTWFYPYYPPNPYPFPFPAPGPVAPWGFPKDRKLKEMDREPLTSDYLPLPMPVHNNYEPDLIEGPQLGDGVLPLHEPQASFYVRIAAPEEDTPRQFFRQRQLSQRNAALTALRANVEKS